MKTYIFRTTTTTKEYNAKHWWIDGNIIHEKTIQAESVAAALEEYRELVEYDNCISISKNAIKARRPMYVDTKGGEKQIGFVITGRADFETESFRYVKQYVDLWVEIVTVTDTEF